MIGIDKSRDEFELIVARGGYPIRRDNEGKYAHGKVQEFWCIWTHGVAHGWELRKQHDQRRVDDNGEEG
jgi:hypothetical protein